MKAQRFVIQLTDENDPWNAEWEIRSTYDDELIGSASFVGEKARGTVPLQLTLKDQYRNKGYGTEIFRMMVNWAFSHSNVYEVSAVCDKENDSCIFALEKAGFVFRSKEGTEEYYSITKSRTSWMGLYIIIGFNVGLVLAIVLNSTWTGLGIGMLICIAIGATMDQKANKKRENITGRKL